MVTTKYGNTYNNEDWNEMMAELSNEKRDGDEYLESCEEIIKAVAKKLVELAGVAPEKSYGIAHHIFENGIDGIGFSSPKKQAVVEDIEKWMQEERRVI